MYYIYLFFNVVCFFYSSFMMENDSDFYNKNFVLGLSVSSLERGGYSTNFTYPIFGEQNSCENVIYCDQEAREACQRATKIFSNSQIGRRLLPWSVDKRIFSKGGSSGLPHAIAQIFNEKAKNAKKKLEFCAIIFSSGELDSDGAIGGFGEVFLKMRALRGYNESENLQLQTLKKYCIFHDSMKNKIVIINNFFEKKSKNIFGEKEIMYPANITDLQNFIETIIVNRGPEYSVNFADNFKNFIMYSLKKKNDLQKEKEDQKEFLEYLNECLQMPQYQSQLSDIEELFFETFENLVQSDGKSEFKSLLSDFFNFFSEVRRDVSVKRVIDYICERMINLDNKNQFLSEVYCNFLEHVMSILEGQKKYIISEEQNNLELDIKEISLYFKNINLMRLKHAVAKIAIEIKNNKLPNQTIVELDKEKWYEYKFVDEKNECNSSLCHMEELFEKIYKCKKDKKEFIAECLKLEPDKTHIEKHLENIRSSFVKFYSTYIKNENNKKIIEKIEYVIKSNGNLYHAIDMIMQNNNNDITCLMFLLYFICMEDKSMIIGDINLMRGMLIQYLQMYFYYHSKRNIEDAIWWINFFSALNYTDKGRDIQQPYKDFLKLLEEVMMRLFYEDLTGFLYLDYMSSHGILSLLKNYSGNNNILFSSLSQTLKIYCFNVLIAQYIKEKNKDKDKIKNKDKDKIIDNIIRVIENIRDPEFQNTLAHYFVKNQYHDIIESWYENLERMLKAPSAYGTAINKDNNDICDHLEKLYIFLKEKREK